MFKLQRSLITDGVQNGFRMTKRLQIMLLVLFILVNAARGTLQHDLSINKCCPQDQVLTPGYTCKAYKDYYTYSTNDIPPWLPSDMLVLEEDFQSLPTFLNNHGVNMTPQMGVKARCDGHEQLLLLDIVSFYSLREDGSLLLYDEASVGNMTFPSSTYCFDRLLWRDNQTVHIILLCPCLNLTCVRKCCSSGAYLNREHRCSLSDESTNWRPSFRENTPKHFQLVSMPRCQDGAYLLNPPSMKRKDALEYWFMEDGRVAGYEFKEPIPVEEYCWDETKDDDGVQTPNLLYCKKWENPKWQRERRVFYGIMLLIDTVFLTITLIVYLALPELRAGLHAKHLMAHTASLLVAFLFLGLGQLLSVNYAFCIIIAFIIQFAFLAAFFWLNVMCIDIAWAFSGLRPPQGSALERDHKKFLFYSAYAWGMTGFISVITAIVEFIPGLADGSALKPNFGQRACWFDKPAATLAYFYGPMAFLLLANLLMFMYTAARIISVRRDTAFLHASSGGSTSGSASHRDRQRLVLYVKLFCLMGLTWVTEIISWAVGGVDYFWYITDVINMLRAVFIFVIFCCKKSVLHHLRLRLSSFLPCVKGLSRKRSSLSGQTSSLRLTTSIKKSIRRASLDP